MPPRLPRPRKGPDVHVRLLSEDELQDVIAAWSTFVPDEDGCCTFCRLAGIEVTKDGGIRHVSPPT